MNLDTTKVELLWVLERRVDSEDHSGFLGLDKDRFEQMVRFIEDVDPYWLARHLRDTKYPLGVRAEVAGLMRGPNANRLLLEILGG